MNNIEERFKSRSNRILALSGLALIASIFTLNSWLVFISLTIFILTVAYNMYRLVSKVDIFNNSKSDIVIIVTCIGTIIVIIQLCTLFSIANKEKPLTDIIKSFSINGLMLYVATEIVADNIKDIVKALLKHRDNKKK